MINKITQQNAPFLQDLTFQIESSAQHHGGYTSSPDHIIIKSQNTRDKGKILLASKKEKKKSHTVVQNSE